MMRKTVPGILAMLVLFGACVFDAHAAADGDQEHKTIGVVMINFSNPFYSSAIEAMQEAAKQCNLTLIIKSAEGSLETEIALIENFIQQGVSCIIADCLDKEGLINVFEKATAAGIPAISLFNVLNPGGSNFNVPYDHYTGFKAVSVSVFEQLNGEGNVLLLSGQKGNYASDERERGFNEALALYPGIKVLANQPCDWDPAKGMSIVETWLTSYSGIDAILCVSDGITPSIVEAVEVAEREDEILIAGNDGEVDVIDLMNEGKVAADALLGSKRGGYFAILYANKVVRGLTDKKVEQISTYLIVDAKTQELLNSRDVDMTWFTMLTPDEALVAANEYV